MKCALTVLSLFVLTVVTPDIASAQECSGARWQTYDDGSYENGYGSISGIFDTKAALLQDEFVGTVQVTEACVCIQSLNITPPFFFFDVVIWDSDGPNGAPGSVLGADVLNLSSDIGFAEARTYKVDLTSSNIVTNRPYYVGVQLPNSTERLFVCADESLNTEVQPAYLDPQNSGLLDPPLFPLVGSTTFDEYRALGLRSKTIEVEEPLCTPNENTLCLGEGGRFRVTTNWRDFQGGTGLGTTRTFDDIDDSGLFWFFTPGNLEVLVKVLNGCPITNSYWVFFAATTNVEFELTVEDMVTNETKTYSNPLGVSAPAVTDTGAFATCDVPLAPITEATEAAPETPSAEELTALFSKLNQE